MKFSHILNLFVLVLELAVRSTDGAFRSCELETVNTLLSETYLTNEVESSRLLYH
jgi:hypothetical protein